MRLTRVNERILLVDDNWNMIKDTTWSFNNIVVQHFREPKIVKNVDGVRYKVSSERV